MNDSWDISTATFSGRDEDGQPIVQAQGYGADGNAAGAPFWLQHQYGTMARPHDGDSERGFCTLFVWDDGSTRYGWLGIDPRFIADVPQLEKGSTAAYAAFPEGDDFKVAFQHLSGEDGTWSLYIPHGDSAVSIVFGRDGNGEPSIELVNSDGSSLTLFAGAVTLKSANGSNYIEVSNSGIVLKGNITQQGGFSAPGGVPLVRFPEFSTAFIPQLTAALTTISSYFASRSAPPGPDTAAAAAAASALAPIITALTGVVPTLTTKSTKGQ